MFTCCRDRARSDSEHLITDDVVYRSSDPGCQLALLFRSVQTCFWLPLGIFEIFIKINGKLCSGTSINGGPGPPRVHQAGGPDFG